MKLPRTNAPLLGLTALAALSLAAPHAARADTTIVGTANQSNAVPFAYNDVVQQDYSAADFTGTPVNITSLTFFTSYSTSQMLDNGSSVVTPATYTIDLSYTNAAVEPTAGNSIVDPIVKTMN